LYSDNTELVGGDLRPEEEDEEGVLVADTSACIDLCVDTAGCRYWSVAKESGRCRLKAWRGRLRRRAGHVSGSLPAACGELQVREVPIFFPLMLLGI